MQIRIDQDVIQKRVAKLMHSRNRSDAETVKIQTPTKMWCRPIDSGLLWPRLRKSVHERRRNRGRDREKLSKRRRKKARVTRSGKFDRQTQSFLSLSLAPLRTTSFLFTRQWGTSHALAFFLHSLLYRSYFLFDLWRKARARPRVLLIRLCFCLREFAFLWGKGLEEREGRCLFSTMALSRSNVNRACRTRALRLFVARERV